MKYLVQNDKSSRLNYHSAEWIFNVRNSLFNSNQFTYKNRLRSAHRNKSRPPLISRIRNFCVYSSRSGSPLRLFRSSRIAFRIFSGFSNFSGVRKSSWLNL